VIREVYERVEARIVTDHEFVEIRGRESTLRSLCLAGTGSKSAGKTDYIQSSSSVMYTPLCARA
jgi:hypothetical protein